MEKPGLSRGIPGALIGVALGAALVAILRALSGIEPVWDNGAAMVLVPFTTMGGWLWGVGAFNPKMSEHHAHPPEDDHEETAIVPAEDAAHAHDAEEETPIGILSGQLWRIGTLSLVAVFIFFALATNPITSGLYMQQSNDAEASVGAIDFEQTFALPFGTGEFEASQLTVFLGFVAFTILSILVVAGGIGFLLYAGHQGVASANELQVTRDMQTPPAPVRWVGRQSRKLAAGLREGLPRFFGMR